MDRDPMAHTRKVLRDIESMKCEWRKQGIHIGFGDPPICVVCDVPFPCPHLTQGFS
jgi:hypothetical protein